MQSGGRGRKGSIPRRKTGGSVLIKAGMGSMVSKSCLSFAIIT